jgi:hypothetical protein
MDETTMTLLMFNLVYQSQANNKPLQWFKMMEKSIDGAFVSDDIVRWRANG